MFCERFVCKYSRERHHRKFHDDKDQSTGEELSNATTSEVDEQATDEGTSSAMTSEVNDEHGSDEAMSEDENESTTRWAEARFSQKILTIYILYTIRKLKASEIQVSRREIRISFTFLCRV